ncbi:MAG: nucleotidyltransferase family protein [Nitrososphaeria archaeon]
MKAVILAGGLGVRLRPYTLLAPKPMLPLGDRPLLEHMIEWLKGQGISEFVIAVGYMKKAIEDYFGDGSDLGVSVEYARSKRPMGTAGQLKTAEPFIDGRFVLVYGDVLPRAELGPMIELHDRSGALATMMLMKYYTRIRYGLVEASDDGRLIRWSEKPEVGGWVNVGCYVMERNFLRYIPEDVPYGMDAAFRAAMDAGEPIYTYRSDGTFVDIGDRASYAKANREFLEELGEIP